MNGHEEAISRWFGAWLNQDGSVIDEIFDEDVEYTECYGPQYRGVDQIHRWFDDWNQKGRVLDWTIREWIHQKRTTVVIWYFRCEYEGHIDGFDGVSIVVFDEEGRIVSLREYQSKAEHVFPYGDTSNQRRKLPGMSE